jgi:hypothetical protein
MKSAISIITCPRPGVDYLPRTAAALLAAGAAEFCARRFVCADGDCPQDDLDGWEVDVRYPRGGPRAMMWWAFERAVAAGVDQLVYCEDDITPTRNAIAYMARFQVPSWAAFVDFHDVALDAATPPGLHVMRADRSYTGNQCMVLPRRTLQWLLLHDPMEIMPWQARGLAPHATDSVLGDFVARSLWPNYIAHVPRLVRHDGAASAAHPDREEQLVRAFPGEDFDAFSLVRLSAT